VLVLAIIHRDDPVVVRFTGRLVDSCAEDLRRATGQATALDIDLSGLTFVDREVERSLVRPRNIARRFTATVCSRGHCAGGYISPCRGEPI
jgi:hypothetical protein